jgi:hypothetical protein
MNPICAGGLTIPRDVIETLRRPVVEVFARLHETFDNLHVWDPMPTLCPAETCSVLQNGKPLFFDGDHLTSLGNRLLTPSFVEFIDEVSASLRVRLELL